MARGHASLIVFEGRLQQLLHSDDGDTALAAAAGYAVLLSDDVHAVIAFSHAECSLLWQQVQRTKAIYVGATSFMLARRYFFLCILLRPGSCCLQLAACRSPPPLKKKRPI
jgi:hypothetical protein